MPYYAVVRGRNQGIFNSWEECQDYVLGYSNAKFRKFFDFADAKQFLIDHGIYTDTNYASSSSSSSEGDSHVNIYTDGCCLGNGYNGARSGAGVFIDDDHRANLSKPLPYCSTNNHAEIRAVTEAALIARRYGWSQIRIYTDSKFVINCATKWIYKWRSNGWRTSNNGHVINKRELNTMRDALDWCHDVIFVHVPGHSGNYGNEMANKLAQKAAGMVR